MDSRQSANSRSDKRKSGRKLRSGKNFQANPLAKMEDSIFNGIRAKIDDTSYHTDERDYLTTPVGVRRFTVARTSFDEESTTVSVCVHDPCGVQIACSPNSQPPGYICICSDGTTVLPGDPCPYDHPVNSTPPAVLVQEPSPIHSSHSSVWALGFGVCLVFIFASVLSFFVWKKKQKNMRRHRSKTHELEVPNNLRKLSMLNLINFANNPNYNLTTPWDKSTAVSLQTLPVHVIKKEQIELLGDLGEGCFGKVFKGEFYPKLDPEVETHARDYVNSRAAYDKMTVAVKILKKTFGPEGQADFIREAQFVSKFDHPNILSLIGIVLTDAYIPWMVLEFMEHGDLTKVLRSYDKQFYSSLSPKKTINMIDLIDTCIDIASGMEYLSSQHFVHRDLACRNCLVGDDFVVKISDFGMCRDVYTCDYYKAGGSHMMPVRWMSPESIMYRKFTLESDVWSYGVVVWEVFSFAKQPYYGTTTDKVVNLILEGTLLKPSDICPTPVIEILRQCWRTEPLHRPSFHSILQMLKIARQEAVQNDGEITINAGASYALLDTMLPIDADAYLLPSPTHKPEYLAILSEIDEIQRTQSVFH